MSRLDQLQAKLVEAASNEAPNFNEILELAHKFASHDPDHVRFMADSGLISRLGKELVARQETAVSELIKNAYDADATEVRLIFSGAEQPGGRLHVRDNGAGMARQELVDGFMRLASVEKIHEPISPHFLRLRAGRKGIGRFAAQRLGTKLTVVTRSESARKALQVSIDWTDFETERDLFLIPNPIEEIDSDVRGTLLIIDGLRESWTESQIARVYRFVEELIQPFPLSKTKTKGARREPDPGFKVILSRLHGVKEVPIASEQEMIFDYALAKITGRVSDTGIGKWHMKSKRLDLDEGGTIMADEGEDIEAFSALRNVAFSAYYFIWLPEYLPQHQLTRLRALAATRGGIRAYRNGFRVLPYGEVGNDWLRLDETSRRRGAVLGAIANINWFGFVEITDPDTEKFDETSSREGLLKTTAYDELVEFVSASLRAAVLRIEAVRGRGKKKRKKREPSSSPDTRLDQRLQDAADEVQSVVVLLEQSPAKRTSGLTRAAEQLKGVFGALKTASPETAELLEEIAMLRVLASLGLTIGMFTHEISTRLAAMRARIRTLSRRKGATAEDVQGIKRIDEHFRMLEAYASYFNATIAANVQRELEPINLREIIHEFIREFSPLAKRRSIDFVKPELDGDLITMPMHRSEWGSILANFLTNSMKAIRRSDNRSDGKVFIRAWREADGILLEFADNGDGIPARNVERIFDAFFTTSHSAKGGSGHDELLGSGLGLKIVRDIVVAANGEVSVVPPPKGYITCLQVRVPASSDVD
jgi:signal transduction histidine kinase